MCPRRRTRIGDSQAFLRLLVNIARAEGGPADSAERESGRATPLAASSEMEVRPHSTAKDRHQSGRRGARPDACAEGPMHGPERCIASRRRGSPLPSRAVHEASLMPKPLSLSTNPSSRMGKSSSSGLQPLAPEPGPMLAPVWVPARNLMALDGRPARFPTQRRSRHRAGACAELSRRRRPKVRSHAAFERGARPARRRDEIHQ